MNNNFIYFPIIKTRDSELRCFKHLSEDIFNKTLPIYELTKSRKTKLSPDGDINKRMLEIGEIQKGKPFILDVTTDDRYANPQTRSLLNNYHGFSEWYHFLFDSYKNLNIIPMIHLYESDDFSDLQSFVSNCCLSENKYSLAIRLPYDIDKDFIIRCLEAISASLSETCKLYIILDVGYFREKPETVQATIDKNQDKTSLTCSELTNFKSIIQDVVVASTSFPRAPAEAGKHDNAGSFDIYEKKLFQSLLLDFPEIKYGDYASINTEQIEIKAATFVPRIDIVSEDGNSFSYRRVRRQNGGYIKCAQEVLSNDCNYINLNSWANKQINLAAQGSPEGISPSFWISVRMNYYITNRIKVIEKINDLF